MLTAQVLSAYCLQFRYYCISKQSANILCSIALQLVLTNLILQVRYFDIPLLYCLMFGINRYFIVYN